MSASKSGLFVPRRSALLGAAPGRSATRQSRSLPTRPPRTRSRSGCCLPRQATSRAQTEYLANGTYLALEERGNKIMGQPAELIWLENLRPRARSRTCRSWSRRTRWLPFSAARCQLQRPGRAGDRGATEDPVRLRQRRRHRHKRQELQPLHIPAEHAGRGAGGNVCTLHHGLWQEMVFHRCQLRVRPGHR